MNTVYAALYTAVFSRRYIQLVQHIFLWLTRKYIGTLTLSSQQRGIYETKNEQYSVQSHPENNSLSLSQRASAHARAHTHTHYAVRSIYVVVSEFLTV